MAEFGSVCVPKSHGTNSITSCAIVNAHDLQKKVQGLIRYHGAGFGNILYVDYIVLKENGIQKARVDPDQGFTVLANDQTISTPWYTLPANCTGKLYQTTMRYKIHWGDTPAGTWTAFFSISSNSVTTTWCD